MGVKRFLELALVFLVAGAVGFGAAYAWGSRGSAARRQAELRLTRLERLLRLEKASNLALQASIQSEKLLLDLTR